MARTNLPTHTLAPNSSVAASAATNIDQANGMNVVFPTTGIPAQPNTRNLLLIVTNSSGSAANFIARAGVNPPAFRSGVGDLTISVGAGATIWVGPLESARFVQSDGSLNLDFAAGFTGTITAILMPERY